MNSKSNQKLYSYSKTSEMMQRLYNKVLIMYIKYAYLTNVYDQIIVKIIKKFKKKKKKNDLNK